MITITFEDKPVQCFEKDNEMWFCGKDVCDILSYAKTSYKNALNKVSQKNKNPLSVFDASLKHNDGLAIYISEFGVIELTIKCRFPTAKPFQEFVQLTIKNLRDEKTKSMQSHLDKTISQFSSQLALTEKSHEEIVNDLKNQLSKTNTSLTKTKSSLTKTRSNLSKTKNHLGQTEKENDDLIETIVTEKDEEISSLKSKLQQLEEQVVDLISENDDLKDKLDESYKSDSELSECPPYDPAPARRKYVKECLRDLKKAIQTFDKLNKKKVPKTETARYNYDVNLFNATHALQDELHHARSSEFFTKFSEELSKETDKFWLGWEDWTRWRDDDHKF
jgi:prophage antirepressor-like protein